MWQKENNRLYKKFTFRDFEEATAFINRIAAIASELNHHPTIKNTYNKVEIWLSTHDAGDIVTGKDRTFAKRVNDMLDTGKKKPGTMLPKEIKLYADGGSRGNPGPSASGYVIMNMDGEVMVEKGVYLGITTNNQAEYQALRFGLEDALRRGAREVSVYMDSLLVINQLKGIFKVKNRDLWPIYEAVKDQAAKFKKINFNHVPRELNKLADAEVNKTLDVEADGRPVSV